MEEKNERKKKKKKERDVMCLFVKFFCACLPPVVWNFSVPNKGKHLPRLCTIIS